uniref:Uncharacterized protein n=1 Tax=Picea glauca TaxID=3330 RepID=A0A101LXZ4_PICGL|nr:hypothetical protein ABT39_MTgene5433 [Picea glauca]
MKMMAAFDLPMVNRARNPFGRVSKAIQRLFKDLGSYGLLISLAGFIGRNSQQLYLQGGGLALREKADI